MVEHSLPPDPQRRQRTVPVTWLTLAEPDATVASESVRLAADGTAEVGFRIAAARATTDRIDAATVLCAVRRPVDPPVRAGGYFGLREEEADRIAAALMCDRAVPAAEPPSANGGAPVASSPQLYALSLRQITAWVDGCAVSQAAAEDSAAPTAVHALLRCLRAGTAAGMAPPGKLTASIIWDPGQQPGHATGALFFHSHGRAPQPGTSAPDFSLLKGDILPLVLRPAEAGSSGHVSTSRSVEANIAAHNTSAVGGTNTPRAATIRAGTRCARFPTIAFGSSGQEGRALLTAPAD